MLQKNKSIVVRNIFLINGHNKNISEPFLRRKLK
nr:MAG TPA: hypothetical protein [Caudoviricetes sp.]